MNLKSNLISHHETGLSVLFPLLYLLFIPPMKMFAQTKDFASLINRVEILGGPSWSSILGNVDTDNTQFTTRRLKSGYSIGFGFDCYTTKRFQLEVLTLYEKKGTIADLSIPAGNVTYDYTYTYFSIPVYGNLRLGRKGIFSIGVGGYSSLLIKQIRTDINPSSQNVGTHDETSLNSPFDFGLCAQIKCLLPSIAGHQLSLRFQETYGLFNTRPNTYSGQAFHSQNMLVIIGVSIFKKSK